MKKSYLQALLIGLTTIGSINAQTIQVLGHDVVAELKTVVPIVEESIGYISNEQFRTLKKYLNKHKSDINLTTLFDNLGQLIGGVDQSVLAFAEGYIKPLLNAAQKAQLAQAIQAVKKFDFPGLAKKIGALKVNLSPQVSPIVKALRAASKSPNFKTLTNSITKIGKRIDQQSKLITLAKINTIAQGLLALKKKQQGDPLTFDDTIALLNGLGTAQRLAPVVTGLVSDGVQLATVVGQFLKQANIPSLPPTLNNDLLAVKQRLNELLGYLKEANQKIQKAKKAAGLG